jgi:hypothetical protein
MVNRPKAKGTSAETAVVEYLRINGWPRAERRALTGSLDKGDIANVWGLAIEVKYANAGMKVGPWLVETGVERINAGADHGILVVKPRGLGARRVGSWYAIMSHCDFELLCRKAMPVGLQATLRVRDGPVTHFTAATLTNQLGAGLAAGMLQDDEILALLLRPRGAMDNKDGWYRVMCLDHMIRLLHAAGYEDWDGR